MGDNQHRIIVIMSTRKKEEQPFPGGHLGNWMLVAHILEKEVRMKVYVVIEYVSFDKSTEILCVFGSKKKAEEHLKICKEDSSHWSEFSFKEFEVG